jgi:pimeloyl-ACP methyl ester carboxylesterase
MMLVRHGFKSAHFVGHSYGTFVVSRFCKRYPSWVHSATFVDPVCFCLYLSHLVATFVYKKPKACHACTAVE